MDNNQSKIQRNFWDFPWGYVESFFIGLGLFFIGFILEVSTGSLRIDGLEFPGNLLFLLIFIGILFILHHRFSELAFVKWLTSVPATISTLTLFFILVLIMGSIPQSHSENKIINILGLNHITSHWSFIFIQLLLLLELGLVTLKRAFPFRRKNIGFMLNHAGLFIALSCGILGSKDIKRLKLIVTEHNNQSIALNANNELEKLNFSIHLNDFVMDEYNPKLAFVSNSDGKVLHNDGKNLFLIEEDNSFQFEHYSIYIEKYLSSAGRIGEKYEPVNDLGTPPAALLRIKDNNTGKIQKGWISCGSYIYPYESLKINDKFSVVMTLPEVKKFTSNINISDKDRTIENVEIIVNKPIKYQGWKIYQLSYDEKMGKWSQTSTLELIKDPWLPIVYVGVFMMITGAIYMFWTGTKKSKSE